VCLAGRNARRELRENSRRRRGRKRPFRSTNMVEAASKGAIPHAEGKQVGVPDVVRDFGAGGVYRWKWSVQGTTRKLGSYGAVCGWR